MNNSENVFDRGLTRVLLLPVTILGLLLWGGGVALAAPVAPEYFTGIAQTPDVMSISGFLTVNGAAAGAGAEVGVYDADGVLCGASGVDAANGGGFTIQVYGDDPTTDGIDEGASASDALRFEVYDPSVPGVGTLSSGDLSPAGFLDTAELPLLFAAGPWYGINMAATVTALPVAEADGDVAPFGARDGLVDVGDAVVALRFAVGLITPNAEDVLHCDVAPLDDNGQPSPDGQVTVGDAVVILRKAVGLVNF